METFSNIDNRLFFVDSHSFNFLASLINGNEKVLTAVNTIHPPFNFLASLINGNVLVPDWYRCDSESFNFLASLINGNDSNYDPLLTLCLLTS